jgi:predicted urease superfamily metal-dependent hydrolase
MIGDLLEKSLWSDGSPTTRAACEAMMEAFVKGYGTVSEDAVYRTIVHAGVHMMNWYARHPDTEMRGKAQAFMQTAVEVIVRAWRGEREWFDGNMLSCLFATLT